MNPILSHMEDDDMQPYDDTTFAERLCANPWIYVVLLAGISSLFILANLMLSLHGKGMGWTGIMLVCFAVCGTNLLGGALLAAGRRIQGFRVQLKILTGDDA